MQHPEPGTDLVDPFPAAVGGAGLDEWLAERIAGVRPPFRYRLIAGGRSNLTYEVVDHAGSRLVLRRPPLGAVLESAHDVGREHRIMTALSGTIPVPDTLAFCADPSLIGAPFYLMDFVDGIVVRNEDDVAQNFDEASRATISRSMIDVLSDLHRLNPNQVGLQGMGREYGYVTRQLRRWYRQFNQSKQRDVPAIDVVHRRLASHIPPQQGVSVVHGDFRIDNCMLGPDGLVRAVLDWELCTLGDPLADLGMLAVFWVDPDETGRAMPTGSPTAMAGFATRDQLVDRYAARSGLDVSQLDFYRALGYWKLACIFEGIYARYSSGVMAEDGYAAEDVPGYVLRLADAALSLTERL